MKATLYDVMWQGEKTFDEVQKYGVEPIRKLLKFIREELTDEVIKYMKNQDGEWTDDTLFLLQQLDDYGSRLQSAIERLRFGYLEGISKVGQWRDWSQPPAKRLEDIEWDNTGAYEDIVSLAIEPMAAFADLLEDRLVEFFPLEDKNSPEYINDHIYRAVQLAAELKRRIRDWSLVYGDLSQEIYEESQRTKAEIASTATMVQGKPLDNRNIAMARP